MIPNINNAVWPGWETVGILGQGSFGAVYEIERDVFGEKEKAALKVISIPQSNSELDEMYGEGYDEDSIQKNLESQLKSIVSEYSLMRKLNSCANVVHCDDVRYEKKTDGVGWNIFIKMELLTPLMKGLPMSIPEKMVIRIGKEMCNALEYCNHFGIIHRDIKPQNMFLTETGSCKLGDFGIAKTIEKTSGGTRIGTFKYMAPEVYHNKPYGCSADIYSTGLVLYWLLNERRMPFIPLPPAPVLAGMDGDAANKRLMGETIPAPKNGCGELKRIVLKACAFDPVNRYANASEMRKELEKLERIIDTVDVSTTMLETPKCIRSMVPNTFLDKDNLKHSNAVVASLSSVERTIRVHKISENAPAIPNESVEQVSCEDGFVTSEKKAHKNKKAKFILFLLALFLIGIAFGIIWANGDLWNNHKYRGESNPTVVEATTLSDLLLQPQITIDKTEFTPAGGEINNKAGGVIYKNNDAAILSDEDPVAPMIIEAVSIDFYPYSESDSSVASTLKFKTNNAAYRFVNDDTYIRSNQLVVIVVAFVMLIVIIVVLLMLRAKNKRKFALHESGSENIEDMKDGSMDVEVTDRGDLENG